MMVRTLLVIDALVRWAVFGALAASSLLLFLMAVIGALDVLLVNVLGQAIPIVSEVSAETLAVVIFLAVAYAQQQREHVSVDLITNLLPAAAQRVLRLVALVVMLAFFSLLTWRTWALAIESWELRQTAMALIPFPVYPFKIGVLIGSALATLEVARQIAWHVARDDRGGDAKTDAAAI